MPGLLSTLRGGFTTPLLRILGFTILGPAAVSLAALAQSIIGSVSAASIFSILQSAGMDGARLVALNGIAVGIAALILLIVVVCLVIVQRMERERRKKDEKESEKKMNKAF
ncbi:9f9ed1d0-ae9f-490d-97af-aaa9d65654ef [Sclerotinia trifoliorum]|uniref:9f9ed1d0-ae9f-490d-97af-aaa9d65654ef n=1 Tax=Sclerotinia trifoliorum TaxID=28548 RepID=A0A8H2W219_9HELO|nr:9f9ed1d0-ae9f-490d-97af-aaa9d65654ef [Sclerotinia trifoliorum]